MRRHQNRVAPSSSEGSVKSLGLLFLVGRLKLQTKVVKSGGKVRANQGLQRRVGGLYQTHALGENTEWVNEKIQPPGMPR